MSTLNNISAPDSELSGPIAPNNSVEGNAQNAASPETNASTLNGQNSKHALRATPPPLVPIIAPESELSILPTSDTSFSSDSQETFLGFTNAMTSIPRFYLHQLGGITNEALTNEFEGAANEAERNMLAASSDSEDEVKNLSADANDNQSGTVSPPPNCVICISKCRDKCYTFPCMHQYCFKCILKWIKIKRECPLCKHPIASLLHSIKSNDDYTEYIIPPLFSPPDLLIPYAEWVINSPDSPSDRPSEHEIDEIFNEGATTSTGFRSSGLHSNGSHHIYNGVPVPMTLLNFERSSETTPQRRATLRTRQVSTHNLERLSEPTSENIQLNLGNTNVSRSRQQSATVTSCSTAAEVSESQSRNSTEATVNRNSVEQHDSGDRTRVTRSLTRIRNENMSRDPRLNQHLYQNNSRNHVNAGPATDLDYPPRLLTRRWIRMRHENMSMETAVSQNENENYSGNDVSTSTDTESRAPSRLVTRSWYTMCNHNMSMETEVSQNENENYSGNDVSTSTATEYRSPPRLVTRRRIRMRNENMSIETEVSQNSLHRNNSENDVSAGTTTDSRSPLRRVTRSMTRISTENISIEIGESQNSLHRNSSGNYVSASTTTESHTPPRRVTRSMTRISTENISIEIGESQNSLHRNNSGNDVSASTTTESHSPPRRVTRSMTRMSTENMSMVQQNNTTATEFPSPRRSVTRGGTRKSAHNMTKRGRHN